jgi:hypothetical protein
MFHSPWALRSISGRENATSPGKSVCATCTGRGSSSTKERADQSKQEQNKENKEEQLGDSSSRNSNSREAEQGCNQSNDEKRERPTQHVSSSELSIRKALPSCPTD